MQYYRFAKSQIIAQDRAKEAADLARERNEFRLMRIEREKQERAEKHAQKAAGAKADAAKTEAKPSTQAAAKKAAIAAAIERAKALKAAATPQNVVDAKPSVQAEIAEIDARRETAKQAANEGILSEQAGDNTVSTRDEI